VPRLRDPRTLLILALLLSWVALLLLMRSEFWTVPPPEVLERQRMVRPPTMQDLRALALQSAAETLTLTALLWPGRAYTLRLGLAAGGLVPYFILTAPLALTSVEQVHRRWLAALTLVLVAAAVLLLARAAFAALSRRPPPDEG
jgi:hypothetical protein